MSEAHPMATDCNANRLCFEGFAGRQVVGDFGGGAITSNGGAVLLREADRAIGLSQRVAGCFLDARDQDSIVHRLETMIAQRVHAIALGYEDVNDHDELRHDPALALLSDTLEPKRAGVAALAGKSTLNRLEHGLKNTAGSDRYHKISVDDDAFEQVFLDLYIASHKIPPKRITLDLDATDDPVHGNQEDRFFHGYYRCHCYLPLYIFDGRHLLVAKLRPANIDAAAGACDEIKRIVDHVRRAWPETQIWLRADSGFCRDDMMTWCEQNGIEYVFGLARNKRLQAMITDATAEAQAAYAQSGKPARVFKELAYRTVRSWSKSRRVIAKAEHLAKGANPRFIVTSLAPEAFAGQALYEDIYCARGEMENRIKECQLDLYADRTSAATMRANQLRLWFASLAYVLITAVRRLGLEGTDMARATAGSIRLRLLKVAALVTVSVRRIRLAFTTACPARELFALAAGRLSALNAPPDIADAT
jgi:hypothetical protein